MKRKKIARPRNNLVALAQFRKAGSHRKSNKAIRKQLNQEVLMGV
jgi:hypothetical protein